MDKMNSYSSFSHQPLAPRTSSQSSAPRAPPFGRNVTPQFFQSVSIRKGKWTAQEEQYALFIIKQFEKGTLRECENGITLRAYLSRKLHCAPMRISKKYAGKSIGKLVYLSKADATEECFMSVETKLRDLEAKFYKSLYEEMHPNAASYRYPTFMMNARPGIMAMPAQHAGMPPNTMTSQAPPTMAVGPLQHQLQQAPQSMLMPQPGGLSMHQQQHQTMVSHAQLQPPSSVHAKNLQQTYLNALQMMNFNGQPQPQPTPANKVANPPQVPAAPPAPTPQDAAPIPAPSHPGAKPAPSKQSSATTMVQQKPQPVKNAPSSDVPDFLLGFEKVSGNAEEQGTRPQWVEEQGTRPPQWPIPPLLGVFEGNGVPLQCSPPLTSRSFDELHRLLGSDLSPKPFDLNASRNEQPAQQDQSTLTTSNCTSALAANTVSTRDGATTAGNFSADVYATFAQQSALAVSQHSAYCRVDKVSSNSVQAAVAPLSGPDVSSSLAAMYGNPNMARQQTSFPSTNARMVSGSERSSDMGSMHGSTSSSNTGTSDTTSNDSDSASDDGPPRKKTKLGEENTRELSSPISPSDRSSPQRTQ